MSRFRRIVTNRRIRMVSPVLFLFSLLAACPGSAFSQFDQPTGATGLVSTGTASEVVLPKSLRLVMQVTAKAKDAKGAIEALAAKKAELKKSLEEMRANMATLQFSDTKLSEQIAGFESSSESSAEIKMMMQMQRQMQRQMGGRSGSADADFEISSLPSAFTSSCQLKVDWDLPANVESDVITLLKSRLEGEVKKRDLLKAGGSVELSDEEQEALELFQAQSQGGYSSYSRSGQEFSSKIFVVGIVEEKLLAQLKKKAFEKAESKANQLAEATGVQKGSIVAVSTASDTTDMYEPYRYMSRNYMYDDSTPDMSLLAPGESEILGTQAADLKKSVTIVVVYAIGGNR